MPSREAIDREFREAASATVSLGAAAALGAIGFRAAASAGSIDG
jgi:hypothetical protein